MPESWMQVIGVYFDNFFTSVALLEELFSWQTMACGTSRARVQGPQALQSKKTKKLSCNQVKHVLFIEDLFLPSNGIKTSLKMCT